MSKLWQYSGSRRPPFAEEPGPGQESVWDYPRPPRLEPVARPVGVQVGDRIVAATRRALRVLETASPPTYYLPPEDVETSCLVPVAGSSFCEWKGSAGYVALSREVAAMATGGAPGEPVGWLYPSPTAAFAAIAGWYAFYPGRIECRVDGERVRPQPGGFYGGWVTAGIVGPIKGEPGTGHW